MEKYHPPRPATIRPAQDRVGPMARLPILLGCLMALGISACASSGGERSAANRDLLTQEEILRSNSQDLYSVIDERRPRWIRGGRVVSPYGASSGESVVVYFDQSRQGGPEMLRGIPLSGISEIRFFSGPDAQQRFGLDHRMGAIVVTFSPRG
ncbi:MAG: hypothetical protein EA421_08435 [Gemmatimonadales bacterium]|nr:MAG: hypothetical protein EA421_08435 [Gemmatimonadales bacterium]